MTVFDEFSRKTIRKVIIRVYGKECQYCRQQFDSSRLHLDRIYPGSEGGEYCLENITLACQKCNLKKSNSLLEEPGASLLKTIAKEKKERIIRRLHRQQTSTDTESDVEENTSDDGSSKFYNGYRFLDTHMESPEHSYMLDVAVPTADFQAVFQMDGPDISDEIDGLLAFLPGFSGEYQLRGYRLHLPLPIDKLGLDLLVAFWREYEAIYLYGGDEVESSLGDYEQHSSTFSVRFSGLTHLSAEDANRFFQALAWLMEIKCARYGREENGWGEELFLNLCCGWSGFKDQYTSSDRIIFSHPHESNGELLETSYTRVDSNPAEVMKSTTANFSLQFSADIAERLRKLIDDNYSDLIRKPSLKAA